MVDTAGPTNQNGVAADLADVKIGETTHRRYTELRSMTWLSHGARRKRAVKIVLWIYFGFLGLWSVLGAIAIPLMIIRPAYFDLSAVISLLYILFGAVGIYSYNTGEKKFQRATWKWVFYSAAAFATYAVLVKIYGVIQSGNVDNLVFLLPSFLFFGPILYVFSELSKMDLQEHVQTVKVGQPKGYYRNLGAKLFTGTDEHSDTIVTTREDVEVTRSLRLWKVDDSYHVEIKDSPGHSSKHEFFDRESLAQYIEENTPFRIADLA